MRSGSDALEHQLADAPASAWPRVAFITAPTIAPAAATLPPRIFSATSGLRREGRVDRRDQRAVVGDDREPAGRDDLVRVALARQHAVEDLARELVVQLPGVDQCDPRGPPEPG